MKGGIKVIKVALNQIKKKGQGNDNAWSSDLMNGNDKGWS